jgi:hypothetical protein
MGLIYYRGDLFDVIDIGSLLGKKKGTRWDRGKEISRVILLKWLDKKLALIPDRIIGLIWSADNKGKHAANAEGEYAARLITPDEIWRRLTGLPYGPHKVRKDFRPGVRKIPSRIGWSSDAGGGGSAQS